MTTSAQSLRIEQRCRSPPATVGDPCDSLAIVETEESPAMDTLTRAEVLASNGSRFVEIVAEAFDLGCATRLANGTGWIFRSEAETEFGGDPERMAPPFGLAINGHRAITVWLPETVVMIAEPKPGIMTVSLSRMTLDRSLTLGLARLQRMTGKLLDALPEAWEALRTQIAAYEMLMAQPAIAYQEPRIAH